MTDKTSAKIERLEQNDKKRKRIFTVVIVLLIAIFIGGMVWGLNDILGAQGTYEFPGKNKSEYVLPQTGEQSIALFTLMCSKPANTDKVKYSVKTTLDIPEDSIFAGDDDADMAAVLKLVRSKVLTTLSEKYTSFDGKFGAAAEDLPPVGTFTPQDTTLAVTYQGECEEDGTPCLDDNGEQKNPQNYYFKFRFPEQELPAPSSALYATFDMQSTQKIIDEVTAEYSKILDFNSLDITCSAFAIDSDMNRLHTTLNYISYKRVYTITADITFKGDYAAFGSHTIGFDFSANKEYFFSNAGVVFEQSEMNLEKGSSEQIKAAVTADESITLKWESSDPSVVTVDEEGYIKGKANSAKAVTVTATFDYLGNTYTDSCTVYVRKPVEKINISQAELTLKLGESKQLAAEVLPHKATIKDVIWVSSNEDIVLVEQDGTVYPLAPGAAEIYAVSKDGNYKSTCKVTVVE